MSEKKTLSKFFDDPPSRWGLRGDPYLWSEMKDTLGTYAYPSTEEQFVVLLEQMYQQLTGAALANPDVIFVERYSHGGMSSGCVSPQFWVETAIPLLLERYRDAK